MNVMCMLSKVTGQHETDYSSMEHLPKPHGAGLEAHLHKC